jgi:hypothetical protein
MTTHQESILKIYGKEACLKSYELHLEGNGGNYVGYQLANEDDKLDFTFDFQYENLGDNLIDIGRYLSEATE